MNRLAQAIVLARATAAAAHDAAAAAHAAPIRTDADQDRADAATRAAISIESLLSGARGARHATAAQDANNDGNHEGAARAHRAAACAHRADAAATERAAS